MEKKKGLYMIEDEKGYKSEEEKQAAEGFNLAGKELGLSSRDAELALVALETQLSELRAKRASEEDPFDRQQTSHTIANFSAVQGKIIAQLSLSWHDKELLLTAFNTQEATLRSKMRDEKDNPDLRKQTFGALANFSQAKDRIIS